MSLSPFIAEALETTGKLSATPRSGAVTIGTARTVVRPTRTSTASLGCGGCNPSVPDPISEGKWPGHSQKDGRSGGRGEHLTDP